MNFFVIFSFVYLSSFTSLRCVEVNEKSTRNSKFIAALVSFPNHRCFENNDVGVCLPKKTCDRKGGRKLGTCAHGYGTCCQFTAQCGRDDTVTVTVNQTLLLSPNELPRTCRFTFPRQPEVCQLRLDFRRLNLNQPETTGEMTGNCMTDSLTVTGSVTIDQLQICGNDATAANHMYLDYGTSNGPIQLTIRTDGPQPQGLDYGYEIRTTQIKCDSPNRVPQNCLQYYTEQSGNVTSYNHLRQQLNNHNYHVCIEKRNQGDRIRWTACNGISPDGPVDPTADFFITDQFPPLGPEHCYTDYVEIPGSDAGRYCNIPFLRSVTTSNFGLRVHFNGNEPQKSPVSLTAPRDHNTICSAANPSTPIIQNGLYWPWASPADTTLVECDAHPKSRKADIGNTGFCLTYNVVANSVPVGDDPLVRPGPA